MTTGFAADLRQAENGHVELLGCVQVGGVDRFDLEGGGWHLIGNEYAEADGAFAALTARASTRLPTPILATRTVGMP